MDINIRPSVTSSKNDIEYVSIQPQEMFDEDTYRDLLRQLNEEQRVML
jgi:hypothetical protein